MLSMALPRTVAVSLFEHPGMGSTSGPGPEPQLGELLQIAIEIQEVSLLPLQED